MTQHPILLIANPAAGRGGAARHIDAASAALETIGAVRVRRTRTPGEEKAFAHEAAQDGAPLVAVLGGDGTWGNVAHGVLAATANGTALDRPRLLLLAAGTGNDFVTSLGAPAHDFPAMAALAAQGAERTVDLGVVDGRHFLNCLGFGFDAAVVDRARRVTWLRGHAVYLATAAALLLRYPGLHVGEGDTPARRRLMYTFANGRRVGGGFPLAPRASVHDGLLDRIVITDVSLAGRVRLLAKARAGRHEGEPEITMDVGDRWTLRFERPPAYQVDGEWEQSTRTEVEVRCLPGAIRVVAPPLER